MRFNDFDEFVVFDVEATGVDVNRDRIVTAFVGLMNRASGEIVAKWEWLVDPGIPIPDGAAEIHLVTTEIAERDGTSPTTVIPELMGVLRSFLDRGIPVCGFNIAYDLSMLDREARRHGVEPLTPRRVIDPLILDKSLWRFRKGPRRLEPTCEQYGVPPFDAHNAAEDATATGRLAIAIVDYFSGRDPIKAKELRGYRVDERDIDQLHDDQIAWALEHAASFQDYLRDPQKSGEKHNPDAVIDGAWPVRPFQPFALAAA